MVKHRDQYHASYSFLTPTGQDTSVTLTLYDCLFNPFKLVYLHINGPWNQRYRVRFENAFIIYYDCKNSLFQI